MKRRSKKRWTANQIADVAYYKETTKHTYTRNENIKRALFLVVVLTVLIAMSLRTPLSHSSDGPIANTQYKQDACMVNHSSHVFHASETK